MKGGTSGPQKFWFIKNPGKLLQDLGTDVLTLCSQYMMNETYCRNMSEFDFFFSKIHMKIFFVWLPKKVLIIFERRIFRVSLSKFGQKSFAPPKICMPLHLVVSRPISASLSVSKVSGLISAATGLGLKPIVLRLWIPQWYDLVKLFNSTTSKLKIFLSAVSADKK